MGFNLELPEAPEKKEEATGGVGIATTTGAATTAATVETATVAEVATTTVEVKPKTELLLPTDNEPMVEKVAVINQANNVLAQIEKLSPEEQKQVEDFAARIDLTKPEILTEYGGKTQQKYEAFSTNSLKQVRGRDLGEVGDLLAQMCTEIKGFNDASEDKGGLSKLFQSAKKKAKTLQVKYQKVSETIEGIKQELMGHHITLENDVERLETMYEQNLEYFKELTLYILAGKKRIEVARTKELPELQKIAEAGGELEALEFSNYRQKVNDFEKQVYDLELTRMLCLQTAPQIRLVQMTNQQLMRKIKSSINNTIPMWVLKIQVALAIEDSRKAAEAQKAVDELTNAMYRETARSLHVNAVEATREAERGIVDIETILFCNTELIATIDDVMTIQKEESVRREQASVLLAQAEEDLRQKHLDLKSGKLEVPKRFVA